MRWTNSERSRLVFFRTCLAAALTAISFLAVTARPFPVAANVSDKLNHLLAFFVLAVLADRAFPTKPFWLKALWLMGYGMGIECVQYFLPCREFSVMDMAADAGGMLIYGAANAIMRRPGVKIKN